MVAKVFPRYAPLDPLPEADMDDRALWLEYIIPGAAGEVIIGAGLGVQPVRVIGNTRWLTLTGGALTGPLTITSGVNALELRDGAGTTWLVADGTTGSTTLSVNSGGININDWLTTFGPARLWNLVKISAVTPTTGWVVTWNGTEYVPQVLPTMFTTEDAQDAAAAMLTAGTHTGITTSYNDASNSYSLTNTITQYTNANAVSAVAAADSYLTNTGGDTGSGNYTFSGALTSTALTNQTGNYTATAADQVITCDATSAGFTITLPAVASTTVGKTYTIKKTDASNNIVTIDANASETIDGLLTYQLLGRYTTIEIINTGAAWLVREATIGSQTIVQTTVADATTSSTALSASTAYVAKVQVFAPITITKLSVIIGTPSGNIDLGIYRTTGTTLTRLVSSGSTSVTSSSAPQTVTVAATTLYPGFDYAFAVVPDNATVTIGRAAVSGPTSFLAGRLRAFTTAFPLPTSLTIASGVAAGFLPTIVGEP